MLEHGHDDGPQLLDLDDGEALEQELLQLAVALLRVRDLPNLANLIWGLSNFHLTGMINVSTWLMSFSRRSSRTELWKSSRLMPCRSSNGSIGRREGSKMPFSIWNKDI